MTKNSTRQIRTRVAPSPTGNIHIGTARAALFPWLFARHNEGVLVLRIEDTDKERSRKEFENSIIEGLRWLGITWDEFYRTSDRTQIYTKYIKRLLENGKAFWCYHTKEELEEESTSQLTNKEIPRHVCEFKKYASEGKKFKTSYTSGVIRLAVNENSDRVIEFNDLIRGLVRTQERLLGDISIARDEEDALYHFQVVVDDYEMDITHIIRGEDHISNTPKHILIQEALGFPIPEYAHLPLVVDEQRKKLSKRDGAMSIDDFRQRGYLPEAVLNFIALLGFTPKEDTMIASPEELIKLFDIHRIHKSSAIYDEKKLDFINGEYIKKMSVEQFIEYITPELSRNIPSFDLQILKKASPMLQERFHNFSDIKEFNYLFNNPEYGKDVLIWKEASQEDTFYRLSVIYDAFKDFSDWSSKEAIKANLESKVEELALGRGPLYWPFRVALSGQKASPDPIDLAYVLGRDSVLSRLKIALGKLKS